MYTSSDTISPSDYHQTEDFGILAVNPELKEKLHCRFVTSLRQEADEVGWILRLIPEGTPDAGFPEVCLIPPGQGTEHILHSFRVDAGIPDNIQGKDIQRSDVDRIIRFALLSQRAFAGPLDVHLPAILSSNPLATFTSHGSGSYDPSHWAKVSMKFLKIFWEEGEALNLFTKNPH